MASVVTDGKEEAQSLACLVLHYRGTMIPKMKFLGYPQPQQRVKDPRLRVGEDEQGRRDVEGGVRLRCRLELGAKASSNKLHIHSILLNCHTGSHFILLEHSTEHHNDNVHDQLGDAQSCCRSQSAQGSTNSGGSRVQELFGTDSYIRREATVYSLDSYHGKHLSASLPGLFDLC